LIWHLSIGTVASVSTNKKQDLMFSQQCYCSFKYPGMLCYVDWHIFTDEAKENNVFIFRVKQFKKALLWSFNMLVTFCQSIWCNITEDLTLVTIAW